MEICAVTAINRPDGTAARKIQRARNIQAGAGYGYTLLWVVAVANIFAMLFQSLSAKLGLVTGRNLAELCRSALPRRCVFAMWGISDRVTELLPDRSATQRVWERYDALWA